MTKIYLIRHAESIANTQGIYQGQSYDSELSPLGIKQADALGKRFADTTIDEILTSPLKRAVETARALQRHHRSPVSINMEPLLVETNHGQWEGLPKAEIARRWPDLLQSWQTTPSKVQFPGGEHFRDTATRAISWLMSVIPSEHSVVVVTHINIIQALMTYIHNEPLDELWKFSIEPTAVTLIESHSPMRVVIHNNTSHLANLVSDLEKQAL